MAHLRSLALLLEDPGGEEVKVWMGPVRARGQDYISIESYLFFFELLAPAFLVEVDLKVGCDPRDSGVPFLRGLFAGDLSCLERLSLGGLLWRWQKRIGCPSVCSRDERGGCKGVEKDGACGSGPVGHKGSWPRLYREEEAYTLFKDHLLLCVFHSKSTAAETNTHTP